MLEKVTKQMEYVWLTLGVVALVYACYEMYTDGFREKAVLLLFPVICFTWYFFRRMLRKRLENQQEQ